MLQSLPTAARRFPARQRMIDLLDSKAWEHLGLTGQEFKLRWYAGEYLTDTRPEVLALDELMRTGVWHDQPVDVSTVLRPARPTEASPLVINLA